MVWEMIDETRTNIVIGTPGSLNETIENFSKHGSTIAVVAVYDDHISQGQTEGDSKTHISIRHTYYVYHLTAFDVIDEYEKLFRQAIRVYFNLSGITVRAVWHSFNVVRVQVLFGHNLVQGAVAEMICRKMLELRSGK